MASSVKLPLMPLAATNSHDGQGGSYSFDPATGQTTLIERAGHQADAPSSTPAQAEEPAHTQE